MNKKEIQQAFLNVLTDAWCPSNLAENASSILSKYYPNQLIAATEDEVRIVKQAQEYVRDTDG